MTPKGTTERCPTDDRKCPKCGTTMCDKFDYRPGPNPTVELAIPTGKFSCMKCGYDPASLSAPSAPQPEPVRELVEALRTAKGSVCEFLAIRQACIDVGGAKGPLDEELIERLAEMQIGVVDRAELSAAEAERVLARYQK